MNIIVPRAELLQAAQKAARFALSDGKGHQPILETVRLTATTGRLTLVSSDMYTFARIGIDADVHDPGEGTCVNAKAFASRVEALPAGPIELELDKDQLHMRAVGHKRRFKLPAMPVIEYPTVPMPTGSDTLEAELAAETLLELLATTSYAMNRDDGKAEQHCLHVQRQGETLQATATDGHRIARMAQAAPGGVRNWSQTWGYRAVRSLPALLEGAKVVTIRGDGVRAYLEIDDWHVSVARVEAAFPPVDHFILPIQSRGGVRVPLQAPELLAIVRGVSVAGKDAINLSLQPGQLTLENVPTDKDERGEALDCLFVAYQGPSKRMTFAVALLTDGLRAMPEACELDMAGELDPLMITGGNRIAIVMPRRPEFAALKGAA